MDEQRLMRAVLDGYTIDEILNCAKQKDPTQNKLNDTTYCYNCSNHRTPIEDGVFSCNKCGETTYGHVNNFIPNVWMYKKTHHSYSKWLGKLLTGKRLVSEDSIPIVIEDFILIVSALKRNKLIAKNVSKYNFYILRICSRRGIELIGKANDLISGKTKERFERNLYGVVYKDLGWDGQGDAYYNEWVRKGLKIKHIVLYNGKT